MKWWESIIHIIGILFSYYAHIKAYSIIFNNKIRKFNLHEVIFFLILTVAAYYNTFYNYGFSKILISFLEMYVALKLIFKEDMKQTLFKTLLIYLLGFFIEIILGMFMAYFFINTVQQFDNNIFIKVLFSILMMLIMILLSNFKIFKNLYNKIYDLMNKLFNMTLLIIISILVLVLLTYYLIISTDIYSIGTILVLIVILFTIIFIAMLQSIKTKKATDKQEILLNFMKEYEMIIDKERIDRHEMVNNLLVLKSIKNKNSKNYNKVLDDILLTYQSNKVSSGLYELPSGLKGLFYYKIYDMKNNGVEVFINISNKIFKDLDNLNSKVLTRVCKILGILLDNAKEAAKDSNDKLVVIDLYKEDDEIIIYIENSINNDIEINLDKIKIKGFSTKGNNRGYGLYIVNRLIGNSEYLDLIQKVNENNKFVSILTIKNN